MSLNQTLGLAILVLLLAIGAALLIAWRRDAKAKKGRLERKETKEPGEK